MIYISVRPPAGLEEIFKRVSRDDMIAHLARWRTGANYEGYTIQSVFSAYVDSVFEVMRDFGQTAVRDNLRRTAFADAIVSVTPLGEFVRGPNDAIENPLCNSARKYAFEAMQRYVAQLSERWPDLAKKNNDNIF